jgi:hypothetical protein
MLQNDQFMARLARIVMLPDPKQMFNALKYHLNRTPLEFNRAIADGAQPVTTPATVGTDGNPLRRGITPVNGEYRFFVPNNLPNQVRVLALYIHKVPGQTLECACGEEPDTVYIVVAPPVDPTVWQRFIQLMGHVAGAHEGLSQLVDSLFDTNANPNGATSILEYLQTIQAARFNKVNPADPNEPNPPASLLNPLTWPFNVHLGGYGFGGALAQILAARLRQVVSVDIRIHLTTFGAPAVMRRKTLPPTDESKPPLIGSSSTLGYSTSKDGFASVRRFAHSGDPITRLMPTSFDFEHIGAPLEDDETRVEVFWKGGGKHSQQVCQALSCHTAYLQIDFRDKDLMRFYTRIPEAMVLFMMLPKFQGQALDELWTFAYSDSRLLSAEGSQPCPWTMVLGVTTPRAAAI